MEVATFMRAALRRWWIAVLVAVVAAGGAYLVTRNTKDSYDGSVVLTVPAAAAVTTGSNGQWIENFTTSLTTSDVVKQIASDTGASTGDLSDGLAATQLNNSSFVEVDYNATTAARAKAVVVSAAKRTAAYLSRSAVQSAEAQKSSTAKSLTTATTELNAARAALASFSTKNGAVDPNIALQSTQSSLTQLGVSRLQATAAGHSTTGFDAAIKSARAQVAKLAPLARQYSGLADRQHSAELTAETAQSRAAAANEALTTAQQAPLIGSADDSLVEGKTTMLKAVGIAAGVGLILGIALALLVAALRRNTPSRRNRRRAARAAATATAETDGDGDGDTGAEAAHTDVADSGAHAQPQAGHPRPHSTKAGGPQHASDEEYQPV